MNSFRQKLLVFAVSTLGSFAALYARTALAAIMTVEATACDTIQTSSNTTRVECPLIGGTAVSTTGMSIAYFDFRMSGTSSYAVKSKVFRVTPSGTAFVQTSTSTVTGFGDKETSVSATTVSNGASGWDYWMAQLEGPQAAGISIRGVGYLIN